MPAEKDGFQVARIQTTEGLQTKPALLITPGGWTGVQSRLASRVRGFKTVWSFCYENHCPQMNVWCQLSSPSSLQLDPPHLMLAGSAWKIWIVLGHLKMHQIWSLHFLWPQRKRLPFPEHPREQKCTVQERKKGGENHYKIFLDIPHLYIISRVPGYYPCFIQKMADAHLSLEFKHLQGKLIAPSWSKEAEKESSYICFQVNVAHNTFLTLCNTVVSRTDCELMCSM